MVVVKPLIVIIQYGTKITQYLIPFSETTSTRWMALDAISSAKIQNVFTDSINEWRFGRDNVTDRQAELLSHL